MVQVGKGQSRFGRICREIGEFVNQDLQALYDQLVEQGSQSLVDALQAGATIEEIDILDLEERVTQTDKADIQRVYDSLMRGSRNHLRAFLQPRAAGCDL